VIGRQPIANTSNITNNNTLSNDNNKLIKLVELLHASLGHAGKSTLINTLKKGILEGVNINSNRINDILNNLNCTACLTGKATHKKINKVKPIQYKATHILLRWYADLMGPIFTSAAGTRKNIIKNARYILVIVDEFSRYTFTFVLANKSDAADTIINHIKHIQIKLNKKLTELNTDGGKEFVNNKLKEFLTNNGTTLKVTNPNSPYENSIVERKNRHLSETCKTLLIAANLPPCFWVYAILHATYIINSLSLKSTPSSTPLQQFYNIKPQLKHLDIFGSDCYIYLEKTERDNKFSPSAIPAIYLGNNTSGYGRLVYCPETGNVITIKHCKIINGTYTVPTIYSTNKLLSRTDNNNNKNFLYERTNTIPTTAYSTLNIQSIDQQTNELNNNNNIIKSNDVNDISISSINPTLINNFNPSATQTLNNNNNNQFNESTTNTLNNNNINLPINNNQFNDSVTQTLNNNNNNNLLNNKQLYTIDELEEKIELESIDQFNPYATYPNSSLESLPPPTVTTSDEPTTILITDETIENDNNKNNNNVENVNFTSHTITHKNKLNHNKSNLHNNIEQYHAHIHNIIDTETNLINYCNITLNKLNNNKNTVITQHIINKFNHYLNNIQARGAHHNLINNVNTINHTNTNSLPSATEATPEPNNWHEVLKSKFRDYWIEAARKEINAQIENNTWTLISVKDIPPNANIIKSRWVFKVKTGPSGEIIKFRARAVAKGFQQQKYIDFFETFAPTVKYNSIKLMLCIANELDLELFQLDYTTAFLNAELLEDIYMEQLPGFIEQPPNGSNNRNDRLICKLNQSLYGLKQSPLNWYNTVRELLIKLGFKSIISDSCIFVKKSKSGRLIIISLYVDDKICAIHKEDISEWNSIKKQISATFKIEDRGICEWILNMEIIRDRKNNILYLSQQKYINDKLKEFGYNTGQFKIEKNPVTLCKNENLTLADANGNIIIADEQTKARYYSMIGALSYAALTTRIDIAFITNTLARFTTNPQPHHIKAADTVFKYLAYTSTYALTFKKMNNLTNNKNLLTLSLSGYSDSDWGSDKESRKSTTGNIILLNNNIVGWRSSRQKIIANSSTEAEFIALCECCKELKWYKAWLHELLLIVPNEFNITNSTTIHVDNTAAIALTADEVKHNRLKHIDIKYKYIKNQMKSDEINLLWTPTKLQLADLLTKRLPTNQFNEIRNKILTTPPDHLKKI